jgi:7-cyano-7-deazaguanine synthase
MTKTLVVLSGGMDSATLFYECLRDPSKEIVGAVNFYYGSKHNAQERKCAEKICEINNVKITEIDLSFMNDCFKSDLLQSGGDVPEGHYADENMKKTVVPFRNGIMLSIAAGLAESLEADEIALGSHLGDHDIYPDCRADFTEAMRAAIDLGTWTNIKLYTPFVENKLNKTDIAELGSKLGVPFEFTYTCYKGGERHCGKCGSCTERKEAFKDSNVYDPTKYEEEVNV